MLIPFRGVLTPIKGGVNPIKREGVFTSHLGGGGFPCFSPDHQLPSLIHEGLILGQKSRRKPLLYSLSDT